jgi:hypothetical protein
MTQSLQAVRPMGFGVAGAPPPATRRSESCDTANRSRPMRTHSATPLHVPGHLVLSDRQATAACARVVRTECAHMFGRRR